MQFHEIFLIVTLILEIQGGQTVGSATGFFYQKDDVTYLVTSRHVVINEEKGHKPEQLVLLLHTLDTDRSVKFPVDLYEGNKALWHDHPSESSVDLVVVELDQERLRRKHTFKAAAKQTVFPENFVVMPGEDVFVMGYPRGKFDSVHNLPLMRNAMVASVHGIPFQSKPCFLIDANLHKGMSGSPVFTKPKRDFQQKDGKTVTQENLSIYFLGVFSGTMSVRYRDGKEEPLGLGQVWYPELIEEVIESVGKSVGSKRVE